MQVGSLTDPTWSSGELSLVKHHFSEIYSIDSTQGIAKLNPHKSNRKVNTYRLINQ